MDWRLERSTKVVPEPASIPSDIARRCPDIHAATADIGVAVAEFYRLS